jgi:hypothetical protein
METAARYETKVILKNIRREGRQWREYVELREGVEKKSRSLKNPPFSEVFTLISGSICRSVAMYQHIAVVSFPENGRFLRQMVQIIGHFVKQNNVFGNEMCLRENFLPFLSVSTILISSTVIDLIEPRIC